MSRSLLNRTRISELTKGIHSNCIISSIDTKDRKGQNGPINKMIYIKFTQLNETKRLAESELAWWKPDPTSEYFQVNLQEMCLQLHNIVESFVGEEPAFDAFAKVFDTVGIKSHEDIANKKWKQSEVNTLFTALKSSFVDVITPYISDLDKKFRMKLTTNYKGEGVEMPKYGKFIEPMEVTDSNLKFTDAELKTHSKAGIVDKKDTAASSTNAGATI